jgi:hypothetical protein
VVLDQRKAGALLPGLGSFYPKPVSPAGKRVCRKKTKILDAKATARKF